MNYFLGIEFIPVNGGVFLIQKENIHDLLERTKLADTKEVGTPISSHSPQILFDGSSSSFCNNFVVWLDPFNICPLYDQIKL